MVFLSVGSLQNLVCVVCTIQTSHVFGTHQPHMMAHVQTVLGVMSGGYIFEPTSPDENSLIQFNNCLLSICYVPDAEDLTADEKELIPTFMEFIF